VFWKSAAKSGREHRGQASEAAFFHARAIRAETPSLPFGSASPPNGTSTSAGNRPSASSRISPASNHAAPQEGHRSIRSAPEPAARIESILQNGHLIAYLIGNASAEPYIRGDDTIGNGRRIAMDIARVVLAWSVFAAFHSLTVSEGYERLARRAMGERRFDAYHRLLFTAYSLAATAATLLYVHSLPDAPLYRVEGWPRVALHAVQAAGAGLLLWTPWDLREFLGLRPPQRRLHTGKAYGIVRHPLYLGFSILLAFQPAQTRNSLATAASIVAYFYLATFLEERRMERAFGEAYAEYRKRVPRFFPFPRP